MAFTGVCDDPLRATGHEADGNFRFASAKGLVIRHQNGRRVTTVPAATVPSAGSVAAIDPFNRPGRSIGACHGAVSKKRQPVRGQAPVMAGRVVGQRVQPDQAGPIERMEVRHRARIAVGAPGSTTRAQIAGGTAFHMVMENYVGADAPVHATGPMIGIGDRTIHRLASPLAPTGLRSEPLGLWSVPGGDTGGGPWP